MLHKRPISDGTALHQLHNLAINLQNWLRPTCLHSTLPMSQTSNNSYKEWLEASIQEGSIYCCPENDIKLDPLLHIGSGAFGAVYKTTIKQKTSIAAVLSRKQNIYSGMTVALKRLFPDKYGNSTEDLHQQLVKEVAITFPLCLSPRIFILLWTNFERRYTLAKKP